MKAACLLLLTLFSFGCGYGSKYNGPMIGGTAAPNISTFAPTSAMAGGAGFVLTITGSGFATNSIVYWNGIAHGTQYGTAQQITANITAADIANAGNVPVYVNSSGQNSNTMNFPVQ